ncbi:MAG: Uma2 family endonuclease [Streptosporangiaceae bacterium]
MTTDGVWHGQDRTLTVADMAGMPDDEFRYELDDGMLVVSPAPSTLHQLAVTRLTLVLSAQCPPDLVVLAGPGVNLSAVQHRVPDVEVVPAGSVESRQSLFLETPPLLAVEVASPRTRLYDRNRKKDVYEQFGIPAYWIIEPDRDQPELTVFELAVGRYKLTARVTGDDQFRARAPFPVTVTPASLVTTAPLR